MQVILDYQSLETLRRLSGQVGASINTDPTPAPNVTHFVDGTPIQPVINEAKAGDTIYIAPGSYDETVTVNKNDLTLIGLGGRGEAYINPTTVGAAGVEITADGVTVINLAVAGESTADYALKLTGAGDCTLIGCSFEGPTGTVVLLGGTDDDQCSNDVFDDCEFKWGGSGLLFDNSGYGYPTQIAVRRCKFHNLSVVHIGDGPTGGGVVNVEVTDCVFDNAEDATEPTDYIKLDRSGGGATDTGIISGCRFARADNEADVLTIAAGIIWCANATEAGWSTGRPT